MDPDPGGPKTCRSGSPTLLKLVFILSEFSNFLDNRRYWNLVLYAGATDSSGELMFLIKWKVGIFI
jgi:hypothetical protein